MPNKHSNPSNESNLLSHIGRITFWEKGEMAYSAIRKINEHKANNDLEKAKLMQNEWILKKN